MPKWTVCISTLCQSLHLSSGPIWEWNIDTVSSKSDTFACPWRVDLGKVYCSLSWIGLGIVVTYWGKWTPLRSSPEHPSGAPLTLSGEVAFLGLISSTTDWKWCHYTAVRTFWFYTQFWRHFVFPRPSKDTKSLVFVVANDLSPCYRWNIMVTMHSNSLYMCTVNISLVTRLMCRLLTLKIFARSLLTVK